MESLIEAQERGLTLFWAHELDAFVAWSLASKGQD
jgi:hypothetical protein